MAITPGTRKRVRAIPRAPDGSAFQNCQMCGVSVAIALADMHECEPSQKVKRFRGIRAGRPNVEQRRFSDQPRSAFCFFMEKFKKTSESGYSIETDRKGFETWKNMSKEERKPFVWKAAFVNSAYDKALLEEVKRVSKPKDGANVAVVDPWEDCLGSGWHTHVSEDEDNEAIDWKFPWEGCTDSGWHTYVPEDETNLKVIGKSDLPKDEANAAVVDPWEDCSGSGWHTYLPEDEENRVVDGKCDSWENYSSSGWHTYTESDD